jgi:hypothetical protein
MDSVRTTFRAIVAAGLIICLGFGGVCATDAAGGSFLQKGCLASQMCRCGLKTMHSNCESACHCGQQLPQKDNYPASKDSGQPLGFAADSGNFSGSTAVAIQAYIGPVLLIGGSPSLIAQGTRLNC